MSFSKEINNAIARNLKLKSVILAVIFTMIFLLQVVVLFFFDYFDDLFSFFNNKWIIVLGPSLLLIAAASEVIAVRYLNAKISKKGHLSYRITYLIVFMETSFPTVILFFVFFIIGTSATVTPVQLLNSPPVSMYFIMILLSSLMLDYRICLFAGAIAAIEYFLAARYIFDHSLPATKLEVLNTEVKAVFIFISSAIAGFVSHKTREAVIASLKSKDDLINRLDHLVHEKTEEIRNQKYVIEEKNKNIIDSIQYARRIQQSQLPTEKYIVKVLGRLKIKQ